MPRTKPAKGTLDCESLDSALTSVSGLLGVNQQELRASLIRVKPAHLEAAATTQVIEWGDALWNIIVGSGTSSSSPDVIHWFHATRVLSGTDFSEGILPLNLILPKLRSFLTSLGSSSTPSNPFAYTLKTENPILWGPNAFLVRDAIVRRDSITHDYLDIPEIVEDLAGGSVAGRFRAITKPCIVKFRSLKPRNDVTRVALYYCYSALWGFGMHTYNNTCFDGHGQTIPRSDIVSIEYPRIARLLPYKWYD
jgi:hypothetical protein